MDPVVVIGIILIVLFIIIILLIIGFWIYYKRHNKAIETKIDAQISNQNSASNHENNSKSPISPDIIDNDKDTASEMDSDDNIELPRLHTMGGSNTEPGKYGPDKATGSPLLHSRMNTPDGYSAYSGLGIKPKKSFKLEMPLKGNKFMPPSYTTTPPGILKEEHVFHIDSNYTEKGVVGHDNNDSDDDVIIKGDDETLGMTPIGDDKQFQHPTPSIGPHKEGPQQGTVLTANGSMIIRGDSDAISLPHPSKNSMIIKSDSEMNIILNINDSNTPQGPPLEQIKDDEALKANQGQGQEIKQDEDNDNEQIDKKRRSDTVGTIGSNISLVPQRPGQKLNDRNDTAITVIYRPDAPSVFSEEKDGDQNDGDGIDSDDTNDIYDDKIDKDEESVGSKSGSNDDDDGYTETGSTSDDEIYDNPDNINQQRILEMDHEYSLRQMAVQSQSHHII